MDASKIMGQNIWSSMTVEGDGSSHKEENEILCKVLKHKKKIVPLWIPNSQM